jgi:hypothetical protein
LLGLFATLVAGYRDGATSPERARRRAIWTGALIALGVLGVILLMAAVGAGVFLAKREMMLRSRSTHPNAPLTQQYRANSGLITAHYPSDFAAKNVAEGSLLVSRNLGLGEEEIVSVTAVSHPITDDVQELARVMQIAFEKTITSKGGTVTAGAPGPAKCETSEALHAGIEIVTTYQVALAATYTVWSCTFLAAGHGYKLAYFVPRERIREERPLLRRILAATELTN